MVWGLMRGSAAGEYSPTAALPAIPGIVLTATWVIELSSTDPVAQFAAQELRRTLQRCGAPPLPIVKQAQGQRISLDCGADGDGFVRAPDLAGLMLRGDGPRGLLYAVYDLLEELGCRWVAPGPTGEWLPRHERIVLSPVAVASRPALPGRCLIIGHDFFLDQAEEWIIWAARNRINTIFIHTIDHGLALGACHLWRWRVRRAKLLPLLRERGMQLELGGHGMANLVPRALFRSIPTAFRFNGQNHSPDHNFCPSSAEAQALLRRNGAAFFQNYPEATVFHLWPDDILGGGWCACPNCCDLSPSDQALMATNELAAVLEQINPQARLAFLAYHDTTTPPRQVQPRPNVVLTYAPRSRSYAHGIGAAHSPVNRPFHQHLCAYLSCFGAKHTPQPNSAHRVFEYYLDGILFKSALPPLPQVLCADLRAYRDMGVHSVQALMTGDRPWLAAPLNAYLFARLAWEPEQDPATLLAEYAAVRAPRGAAALVQAYNALASAWQPVLEITPAEQMFSRGQRQRRDWLNDPPCDVLDYMAAPRPLREHRLELLEATDPLLAQGRRAWEEVLAHAHAATPHLNAERAEWELGALLIRFVTLRQRLYVLEGRAAPQRALRAAFQAAQAALNALCDWGTAHLNRGRPRSNYHLLRMLAQFHLYALANRRLAWPWERLWLRLHGYARLAWLLLHNYRA